MRPALARTAQLTALALATVITSGCRGAEPVVDSREALGTIVSVTAYGADDADIEAATDRAFDAMAAVESALDAHDTASPVARINAGETADLPAEALAVFDAIDSLEVTSAFSPFLFDVVEAYAFEQGGQVPAEEDLARLVAQADRWRLADDRSRIVARAPAPDGAKVGEPGRPALDFGGASKGLALDRAVMALRDSGAVDAALVTAGSTTVTFGEKPDGEPWRIGIEDPRAPENVVAVIEARGPVTVSTSGDYQRYFERDGVRYHHIINPETGRPARGLRSLTVVGAASALESDILSTALFVMGPARAETYAREHGLGLYMVDAEGRAHLVEGPEDASWAIRVGAP